MEVLTKVYAKCVDGQRDAMNERIAAILGDSDLMIAKRFAVVSQTRTDSGARAADGDGRLC